MWWLGAAGAMYIYMVRAFILVHLMVWVDLGFLNGFSVEFCFGLI